MEHRQLHSGSRDPGNSHCQSSVARPNSPFADKHHRVRTVKSCYTCSLAHHTKTFAHCSATQHLHWSSRYKAHLDVCLVIVCMLQRILYLMTQWHCLSSQAVHCCCLLFPHATSSWIGFNRWCALFVAYYGTNQHLHASANSSHDECWHSIFVAISGFANTVRLVRLPVSSKLLQARGQGNKHDIITYHD